MQAADVMTRNVVLIQPDTKVKEIAGLLLKHRISAVPVVDSGDHVVGVVSEGDLMRRAENDTDTRHAWWLAELLSARDTSAEYIKSHGQRASDVMTRAVITVTEDTPVHEIAQMLERHQIKRVPVTRSDQLVGIVSRANLLHGLATRSSTSDNDKAFSDRELREAIIAEMAEAAGIDTALINVTIDNGAVQLWGALDSATKRKAADVAAQSVAGVQSVENNIGLVPPWVWAA